MTVPTAPKTASSGAWAFLLGIAIGVSGCARTGATFLRIPVRVGEEHPGGDVRVRIPYDALQRAVPGIDPARAGYYYRGREPLPRELQDADGDGVTDAVSIVLPAQPADSLADPDRWIVVVYPGPSRTPDGGALPRQASARGVTLDFEHAVR